MKSTISAHERLASLPAVFRGAELTVRFQWTSKTASHYLYLWKRRNLVSALGGHSDVFANLVVCREPNWEGALRLAMPSAVLVGVEILRRAGWTTQIPYRPEAAVNSAEPTYQVDHFDVKPRPPGWFKMHAAGMRRSDSRGVAMLTPSWALAEMIRAEGWGACGLTPDDIYWDAVTDQDRVEWDEACDKLGLGCLAMNPDEVTEDSRCR
jgi:hypothetical protein